MTSEAGTRYYKKRQESLESLAYQIKRKKIANEVMREAYEEIDECLKQAELIYSGKKASEKNGFNQELWKEVENNFMECVVDAIGEELLLERAQQKGHTTVEALRNLIAGRTEL